MAGHLLPVGSVFAFLATHRHDLFPDDAFEDLFPSGRGRPSVPADVIAAVMVLQSLHNLSDRDTADAVAFDLRWNAWWVNRATGINLKRLLNLGLASQNGNWALG